MQLGFTGLAMPALVGLASAIVTKATEAKFLAV